MHEDSCVTRGRWAPAVRASSRGDHQAFRSIRTEWFRNNARCFLRPHNFSQAAHEDLLGMSLEQRPATSVAVSFQTPPLEVSNATHSFRSLCAASLSHRHRASTVYPDRGDRERAATSPTRPELQPGDAMRTGRIPRRTCGSSSRRWNRLLGPARRRMGQQWRHHCVRAG